MNTKPCESLASFILLPDLCLDKQFPLGRWGIGFNVHKTTEFEICPKCANKSYSVHSYSTIEVKDAPIRGKAVFLFIHKRRFRCHPCSSTFTEPIPGIWKGARTTQRLVREVNWATDKFSTLSDVEDQMRVSTGFVFKAAAAERDKKIGEHLYPLPKKIGLDEHSLKKPKYQAVHYATIVIDHSNKRVYDLIDGRSKEEVTPALRSRAGLKNVEYVTMDLSSTYRNVVRELMPAATIIADHFHVKRCFTRLVNKMRKKVTGDKRKNPIRKLVLRNGDKLLDYERDAVWMWLNQNPNVREVYQYKEAISRVYRAKGLRRATASLLNLIKKMNASKLDEVKSLAKVINNWKREILAYHKCKLSNARCEGFNRKAKLCQRAAYGYRSFENYRRKVLTACF